MHLDKCTLNPRQVTADPSVSFSKAFFPIPRVQ